ncbi:MAG: hypothetical protein ABFS35_19900, partial [Bacteroidota bacterium]
MDLSRGSFACRELVVMKYKNIDWHMYHGALVPNVPRHKEINLTKNEANELLSISKAYFLRYTNEWDRGYGEFWYVIKDKYGGIQEISKNYRKQIRKGLENCIVKRVSKEEIAEHGYEVYRKAFEKYHTNKSPENIEQFVTNILNSNYDNWAVYAKNDNKMIAYSLIDTTDNVCNKR